MRSLTRHVIPALLLIAIGLSAVAHAELVPIGEAQRVADNFVQMMIVKKGVWAGTTDARTGSMVPLTRGDRLLAYVYPVEPMGYVVVAAYWEMEPIRAFSTRSNLDPDDDTGLTDAIRVLQEEVLNAAEGFLGHSLESSDDFHALMEVDARSMWAMYLAPAFNPEGYREPPSPPRLGVDYQEGETLLETTWSQGPPYNDQCPDLGCNWDLGDGWEEGYEHYNENAWAGCVATAGAQICRYYNWPPRGTGSGYEHPYDWANMPEQMTYYADWQSMASRWNGVWRTATAAEVDAIALISRKVGVGVNMSYGCDGSGAFTEDLAWALPGYFRFDENASVVFRPDWTYSQYIGRMMVQLDLNRPMAYKIPGHAIVVDGYDEIEGSYLFHVVYGHNGSDDGWFGIGSIPGGGSTDDHHFVRGLLPENYVQPDASGVHGAYPFPYRYFVQDFYLQDLDLEFSVGNSLQVLGPGLLIENTDTGTGAELTFTGMPLMETVFFLEGNPAEKTRIVIHDGQLKIHEGGQMVIH